MSSERSNPSDGASASRRLLARGSIYTVATAAQLGAGILVLPALTRLLDPEDYGIVTSALVIYQLLGASIGFGLAAAITRAYFKGADPGLARERAVTLVWATLISALLFAGLAELTGPRWSALFENIEYDAALRLAVWSSVAFAVLQSAQSVIRADDRAGAYVVHAVVATAGAQGLGLACAALWGVTGYLAGVLAGVTLAAVIATAQTGRVRRNAIDARFIRRNLAIGGPSVPHALAMYVLAAGDRVVVERIDGLSAVAAYHVAFLIGFAVILLSTAVNNALVPIVFGAREDERWDVLAETMATALRAIALVAGSVALVTPALLDVVAPDSYGVSGLEVVTVLVAVSAIPFMWHLASGHVILWDGRTAPFAVIAPVVAALKMALAVVLLREYGLEGVAWATLATYVLLAAGVWGVARRMANVPWPWRSAALSCAVAGIPAAASLILGDSGFWLAVRGGLGVLIGLGAFRMVKQVIGSPPSPAPA